jgi:putative acetyltransferase
MPTADTDHPSPSQLLLRFQVARAEDEPAILEFFKRMLAQLDIPFIPGISDEGIQGIETQYAHRGLFFVVRHSGEVAGTGALREINSEDCFISKLCLDAFLRGDGLGQLLLDLLLAQAREFGYRRAYLITHTRLQSAMHLFTKAGFLPAEDQTDLPASCDLRMVLELPSTE